MSTGLSESQIIDQLSIQSSCPRHEDMPITHICTTCRDKLKCSTCVVADPTHQNFPIKQFILNYVKMEQKKNEIINKNKQYKLNTQQLNQDRDIENQIIEDHFLTLFQLMRVLIENTKKKFQVNNKEFHEDLIFSAGQSEELTAKKAPTIREQLAKVLKGSEANIYNGIKDVVDNLVNDGTYDKLDQISLSDKLNHIPKLDIDKFNQAQNDIMEYTKIKLRDLLEYHSIKANDLSWHSRTTDTYAIYTGHTDEVYSLTELLDTTLVSSSKDQTLRTWDTISHQGKEVIPMYNKNLNGVCTLPNGKLIIAVENNLKIYDVAKKNTEKTFTGHVKPILCVCPTFQGNILSAGQDQVIKHWNANTGQLIKTYYGHDDYIRCIKMSPDGKTFISSSDDKSVKVWDLNNGEIIQSFDSHSTQVYAVDIAKNGHIVTGSHDGSIKIWDPKTEKCLQHIKAHNDAIYALSILVDGMIATGSADNNIKIHNPKNGDLIKTLQGHSAPVRATLVLRNGYLASCSEDHNVIIWAGQKLDLLHTLTGHTKQVWSVAGLSDYRMISGSEDRTVKVWDANAGKCVHTFTEPRDSVRAVLYNPQTEHIIIGGMDKFIRVFEADTYDSINTFQGHSGGIRSLSLTSNKDLISGGEDKLIKVWNKNNYQCILTLEGHDDYIRSVCGLSGGRICSGSRDNTLRVWGQSGEQEMILKGHKLPIWTICELQDTTMVATGSADYTIKVWNLELQKCLHSLEGHTNPVWGLSNFNEIILLSVSEDCTMKLWDWQFGQCIRTMNGHSQPIWSVSVSKGNGTKILVGSGSWDKSVKIWQLKKLESQLLKKKLDEIQEEND